jgi:tRNA pseudouridine55 synthase
MAKNKRPITYPPLIFNIFKPARMTSYDVIRHFKKNLPDGYGKIGHFGTLDPFASGVLLVGVAGAARLNDFVHEHCPKTYLAVGKLGVHTETGDLTVEPSSVDESDYLKTTIKSFTSDFIEERIRKVFLGEYMQSPHKYSAAKFEGRKLHEWAREGVDIKKDKVKRHIYELEVVRYEFPYLSLRVKVSSGTYIRTLFKDIANDLGTHGTLVSLVRESIGKAHFSNALLKKSWPSHKEWNYREQSLAPHELFDFNSLTLGPALAKKYTNGMKLEKNELESGYYFIFDQEEELLGLSEVVEGILSPVVNFPSRNL